MLPTDAVIPPPEAEEITRLSLSFLSNKYQIIRKKFLSASMARDNGEDHFSLLRWENIRPPPLWSIFFFHVIGQNGNVYKFSFVQKNVMIHGETFGQHPFREARDTGKKSCPPPSRFDGGIVEETGLNFFSGLELDFNQRTIFKLACASSNSRKTLRENNRSIFIYKKAINRKVKVKLNSPPSSLSSSFPIHSPHVFNYCKFIVRFILDAPIFPPPSSMQLHKMCNLRNCIAQQQRLTRVNPWDFVRPIFDRASRAHNFLPLERREVLVGASVKRTE